MSIGSISLGLAGIAFVTPRVFNALYPPTVERASLDEKVQGFFNKIREKIYSPTPQTTTERKEEINLPLGSIEEKVKKIFALGILLRNKINQLAYYPSLYNFCTVILPDNLWLSILTISLLWKYSFLAINPCLALGVASLEVLIFSCILDILRRSSFYFLPPTLNQLVAPSPNLLETATHIPGVTERVDEFFAFCIGRRRERAAERQRRRPVE